MQDKYTKNVLRKDRNYIRKEILSSVIIYRLLVQRHTAKTKVARYANAQQSIIEEYIPRIESTIPFCPEGVLPFFISPSNPRLRTHLQHKSVNVNRITLSSPFTIIEIVKASRQALVEDTASAKSESAVSANAEASSVESASLWWVIELELVVAGDVAGTAMGVLENAVGKRQGE